MKTLNIVTGISGAGKSMALKAFEDLGYEVIDNLPLSLLPGAVDCRDDDCRITVCIDIRTRSFSADEIIRTLSRLKDDDTVEGDIIFLDCSDEVIRRRYTETRRRHPLGGGLAENLAMERAALEPLKEMANVIIDTSTLSGHDLKRMIENRYTREGTARFLLTVMSFAYKNGVPAEADLVFDVRFLKNPYYVNELRDKTGLEREVRDYIKTDPDYAQFWQKLSSLLLFLLPRYVLEGKSYLTVGFGCTGGRHRSVTLAEEANALLAGDYRTHVLHREINKSK